MALDVCLIWKRVLLLLLLQLLPQVVGLSATGGGQLSITYTSTAAAEAAASDGASRQLVLPVDAVVLATGGFGASKELLKVGQHCVSAIVIRRLAAQWVLPYAR